MNKLIKKLSPFIFLFLSSSIANAQTPFRSRSYFDSSQKVVICREPLPEFTLNYDSNPSNNEVSTLCTCVWNKFPETSWQKKEMLNGFKVMSKNNPDSWEYKSMWRGFVAKFGKAIRDCGGEYL